MLFLKVLTVHILVHYNYNYLSLSRISKLKNCRFHKSKFSCRKYVIVSQTPYVDETIVRLRMVAADI